MALSGKMGILRDLSLLAGFTTHQLVGEVTAHQGYDGYPG